MATRLDLRTRARIRADQDASTFPTDTQYNYFLDEAGREVWYDLIRAGWPISFAQASTTVDTSTILTLSGAFLVSGTPAFIRGVYHVSGGTYNELKRLPEGERAATYTTGGTPQYYDVRMDMSEGLCIQVLPFCPGADIVVEYITEWPGFATDASVWPGPARSDEMVVLKAAIKGCRKEGNDQGAQFLVGEYEELKESVQAMASWVNMRNPATIRDVGPLAPGRLPGDYDIY